MQRPPLTRPRFVEELDPQQKTWTTRLAKLLVKIKDTKATAAAQIDDTARSTFLRRYDRIVGRAERLNRPPPLCTSSDARAPAPPPKRTSQLTPQRLARRLRRRRDDILRFMADPAVPFDNNGAERDLRMLKLQQKVSGCFRTADGARRFCRVRSYLSTARKHGHSLLRSLERAIRGKPLAFRSAADEHG